MTEGVGGTPAPGGAFGRMVRAPWFSIVGGIVTLGLIAAVVLVAVPKFAAPADPVLATYLPSAFPTTMLPSQVVGTRAEAITLDITTAAPAQVESVQVWDGDRLYYELAPAASGPLEFELDYVPLTAGVHVISTRVVTTSGQVSFSDPFTLAVQGAIGDDLTTAVTEDGPFTLMHIRSSPGDTVESIAARLGVETAALSSPFSFGESAALGAIEPYLGSFDAALRFPAGIDLGTIFEARAPSPPVAQLIPGFGLIDVTDYLDKISASVADCRVTVTTADEGEFALYSSTPLHPGFVRVGDVSKDAPWVSDTMHLGTAVFRALSAQSAVEGSERSPTPLAAVTVPDSCLGNGWTGDLTVTNGVLVTNQEISNSYAYISVDKDTWRRFPANNGAFLPNLTVNDVRSAIPYTGYDQVDVQVWTYQDGRASLAAAGQYCHALAVGIKAGGIGDADGCRPRVDPVDAPPITSAEFTLTAAATPAVPIQPGMGTGNGLQTVFAGDLDQDPSVSDALLLTADTPITLTADLSTNAASKVLFQFSFFPISPTTVTLDAPGVFYSVEASVSASPVGAPGSGAGRATKVVNPWLWQGFKLDAQPGSTTFSGNGTDLSIDDEVAYSIAAGNLAAGKNLTDVVYVRAIAVGSHFADQPRAVVASRSVRFDLGDPDATYPILADPSVFVTPGFDEKVPSNECLSVVSYPFYADRPAGSWEGNTNWLAGAIVPGVNLKGGDPLVLNNHYSLAHSTFPNPDGIYCLDPNRNNPPKDSSGCGWGCALVAIAVGFAVGVVTGGVGGGIAAGLIVGAFALGAGEFTAQLVEVMKGLWDLIASTYNTIYQTVLTIAVQLNPVCAAISAVAAKGESAAATACSNATKAVVTAVITSVTGLPPSLPTSTVLEDVAKGELASLAEFGMDLALGQIGLSCNALTVEGPGVQDLADIAAANMEPGPAAALTAAKTENGGLSACKAFATLAVGVVVSQITGIQQSQQEQVYGVYFPPGLITKPVADTPPTVTVTAPAAPGTRAGDSCPAVINVEVSLPWRVPGDITADKLWTFALKPVRGTIVAVGDPADLSVDATGWQGDIPVPVLPNQYGYKDAYLYSRTLAVEPAPLIHGFLDSPCLDATWEFSAQTATDAWIADPRAVGLFK